MGKDKGTKPKPKRKRNTSSPNLSHKPVLKRNKLVLTGDPSDSEGEVTDYFDAVESDSEKQSNLTPPQQPSITPPQTMKFSQEDLATLSSKLAPLLIKELKQAFKEECLAELRTEIGELIHKQTQPLRDEITRLSNELSKTKLDHDELAQYGRRMCLDISNLPGDSGSYDEPVENKILAFADKAKIPLKASDIDRCHRKGKPKLNVNRKIIIKFTNSKARDNVYKAMKSLPDGLFVQDNLTPYRESLGYEARKLKRENLIEKNMDRGLQGKRSA